MFLSRNKKNNVYPCKTQFYYIKVEFKGSKLYRHVFVMFSIAFVPKKRICHLIAALYESFVFAGQNGYFK